MAQRLLTKLCKDNVFYRHGFTLIELVVSLTVLAILLVFAVPSFQNLLMNNRILAKKDAFLGSLNYARNTALSKNMNILVCPFNSVDSTNCGGNWSDGWIVITQPTNGTPILLQSNLSGEHDPNLTSIAASGAPAVGAVLFDGRGITTTQAAFKICDDRGGAFARSIEVLPTGFVQSASEMGVAVWDGGGLTCP